MSRVLIIGLDGATWKSIEPLVNEGKLPTFKRLLEEGSYGELESTIPSWSIPAWNSITTGKNPGKLGFFSFMSRDYGSYEFKPDFLHQKEKDIWDILSEAGKKVILVNVPNIHKGSRINGYVVVGFLYLDRGSLTYPKTLKSELDEIADGYKIDVLDVDSSDAHFESVEKRFETIKSMIRREKHEKYIERVYKVIEKRLKAIEYLLSKEWDFAFVVFVAPDRLQHKFWMHKRILSDCYERLDEGLKDILKMINEQTIVILISDHGFGPRRRVFNVNDWLIREGYLTLKSQGLPKFTRLKNILRKMKMLSFAKFLIKLLPSELSQILEEKTSFLVVNNDNIDWTKTKVFTQPSHEMCGDLYLNLRGREAKGTINQWEYEKTRDEIIHKLKNLREPRTNKKISATVYKREEIYEGEYLDRAPDLIIQADDNIQGFDTRVGHNEIFTQGTGGDHRTNGIFIAYGPNMQNGIRIRGAKIYDIAPTILHIFDLAIPKDMDGKVLKEIFKPDSILARRKIRYRAAYKEQTRTESISLQEEEKVKERLRSLGYI